MRLESTKYGQSAMMIDTSGCLAQINKRNVAGAVWLGKTTSEALTFEERN